MKKKDIEAKTDKLLEERAHEDSEDEYIRKCLSTNICPWCRTELKVNVIDLARFYIRIDYYCPKCKERFAMNFHRGLCVS